MLDSLKEAKIGSIIPVYKEIDMELDALEYFAKLSDYGRKKNSILLENDEKSLGSVNPCLVIIGKDSDFEIKALNALGKKFLNFIKKDFKFCDKAVYAKGEIYGKLTPARKLVSEQERLKLKTHMDIIREIAFKFKPAAKLLPCGLFGMISYDFISQVEDLLSNSEDLLKDPDYMLYFLDNMFVVEHKTKKTYFVANALIMDKDNKKTYNECSKTIKNYEKLISKKAPKGKKPKKRELKLSYDTGKDEFLMLIKDLMKHIADGDILYASPSKTTISTYNAEPFDIYTSLKNSNSENYAFYMNDSLGISISSGAASVLSVNGDGEKIVELKISTASKPRGAVKEEIDRDLDNKYEALLKVDENEIAYNIMIADDARNDLARISEPGTRYADKLFSIDKQNKSQNIVSNVKGILNKDLDALHAYIATMNAATSGIPKVKSMQLLKNLEKGKRCFNSGSFLYITPDKNLHSIAAEPIRIKKDKAYFRTSCRVFHNSSDEKELKASDANALKILNALKSTGGVK